MPWNSPQPSTRRVTARRAILITLAIGLASVGLMIALSIWIDRPDSAKGHAAIAAVQHARAFDDADAEDDNLADDEVAAGALWARSHPDHGAASCPSAPKAFERGCIDEAAIRRR